jgi:hypothetical protein
VQRDGRLERGKGGAVIDCGMCGHAFTQQEGAACRSGCPVAGSCGMVTCPACGYEFPPESKLLTVLTNLVRRKPAPATR